MTSWSAVNALLYVGLAFWASRTLVNWIDEAEFGSGKASSQHTPKQVRSVADWQEALIGFAVPAALAGLLYVVVFGALLWNSTSGDAEDFLAASLFFSSPPELGPEFFSATFPMFSATEARPMVYALGLLYGMIGLSAALLILSGGIARLVVSANGIYLSYFVTKAIATNWTGELHLDQFSERFFNIKLAYVMLLFYLAEGMSDLAARRGWRGRKFEFLLEGIYGLVAGWLLARTFGSDSVVLTGAMFILIAFAAMFVFEKFIGLLSRVFQSIVDPETYSVVQHEVLRLLEGRSVGLRAIWHGVADPQDRATHLIGFAVMALFPLLFAGVWLVLERL